jgi:hypothetical protein
MGAVETIDGSPPVPPVLDAAGRQLRAPWVASVAGLLFALFFTVALVLLRTQPTADASDTELALLYASGQYLPALIGGLYLAPLAGIMFLWFVAVIRDQIGEREDHFFSTVFFGSGVIFVACLFVSAAVASGPIVGYQYLDQGPPLETEVATARALSYAMLFAFASRAAAVFMIATASVGIRSGTFPRWFTMTGYGLGLILLFGVVVWDWIILVLPAWVAVVSLFILRRERARGRLADARRLAPHG